MGSVGYRNGDISATIGESVKRDGEHGEGNTVNLKMMTRTTNFENNSVASGYVVFT